MKKLALILLLLTAHLTLTAQEKLPKVQREFRGMWIATVANLDFPSSRNLTAEQQKAELVKLMNLAQELKLNAVIFQVSSMQDAMYESKINPWSEFLTGQMGKKGEFDQLKFAIDEAHRRGILLHAWFNPYRASHDSAKSEPPANHITKRHPEWIRKYGNMQILDPAEKGVQANLINVVSEVVKRYDVDGVHFDDYFYPYPEANQSFPDDVTWNAYVKSGGKLSRDDWRRKNVDDLIQKVSIAVKKIKPKVMFGVSPFGIWKPDASLGIKGLSSYDALYADSRKWLQSGWVDYLAPQLYWSTTQVGQQFPVLMKWWNSVNTKKRHLWAGIATYRVGTRAGYTAKDLQDQIEITRNISGDDAGTIHFRALSFTDNKENIRNLLRETTYAEDAIIPASPWIKSAKPKSPQLTIAFNRSTKKFRVSWKNSDNPQAFRWILYWKDSNGWKTNVLSINEMSAEIPQGTQRIAVATVDRLGNVSAPTYESVNTRN